ncbi:MAG TPA: dTDP-4-dehydrorhamnose reductase [Bacteroidetes bacterium]|nr:dTDP-4-dehydrorhamnose reductase [Bacteroidota bacterium]
MRLPNSKDIILLTGSSGQLGYEWSQWLINRNLTFLSPTSTELNLSDPDRVDLYLTKTKPTFIINCAAYTKVDLAEDEIQLADTINHRAVSRVAIYSKNQQVPVIHYSTDYVFNGNVLDGSKYPNGYPIEAQGNPTGVYGETKLKGETALIRNGGDFLVIRVAWLSGRHGNNFVKTMLRLSENMDEIRVVSDQLGSPTFASDVVEVTTKLLEKKISGIRHVSSRELISWADFAAEIMKISHRDTTIKRISSNEYPTKAKRPLYSKLDCTQTESDIGEEMPDWRESLTKLLAEI